MAQDTDRTTTADVIVAGAGHNGLITAAYVARTGRSVIVVDARDIPGGGAASEELVLPGFWSDTCSTGHTLILDHPVIADDDLGLRARHGLEYVHPDPFAAVRFPDGEHLVLPLDVEGSEREIARFSRHDAHAFRRLLDEWSAVAPAFRAANQTPIGMGPSLDELLGGLPGGDIWRRRRQLSAWDVVHREYESRHIRAFMLWMAFQTYVSVDLPGSGALAVSVLAGRQRNSWAIPRGGSGRLTDTLVAEIERLGGQVLCGRRVARLLLDGERCVGVETDTGERFLGTDAVVSSIHVKHLLDMAPRERWPESFVYGVETFDPGLPMFAMHLATDTAPKLRGVPDPAMAVSSGLIRWSEDLVAGLRRARDGAPQQDLPWVLIATPTLADPSRAPEGHHTVKLLTVVSPTPPEGFADWDAARDHVAAQFLALAREHVEGIEDEHILGTLAKSPLDLERANAHMLGGAPHGGDRGVAFSGPLRPAPGWAQHRMPIAGLYQTGGTTHPGGSITGAPGRNAARVLLADLGVDIDAAPAGAAGRGA
jgi:phytoene dehydrogenase-like protein